jgi:NADH:ubiquinone oxidoreductase subunit 6 (subunit J)
MNTLAMPPKVRVYVYAVIGLVSLAVGAVQVGFASINEPNPEWLTVALAVVPFLAAGLGYTAATHTPSETTTVAPSKALDPEGDGQVEPYVGEHRPEVTDDGQAHGIWKPSKPQGYWESHK